MTILWHDMLNAEIFEFERLFALILYGAKQIFAQSVLSIEIAALER